MDDLNFYALCKLGLYCINTLANDAQLCRVKRSLDLTSRKGSAESEAQDEALQSVAGIRKRSELFSPPMPRKFSRSMEDAVAAGIINKLQLGAKDDAVD